MNINPFSHLSFNISGQAAALYLFGFLVIGLGAVLLWGPANRSLEEYTRDIIARCSQSPYQSSCYNELIPEYFDKVGLTDTFNIIRLVQQNDRTYGYCHLAAHEVARQGVAKDPAGWRDVLSECPRDGMCANGCLHGALITRFIGAESGMSWVEIDEAIEELRGICELRPGWDPSTLDKGNCYHGLGHLAMYMTVGDIDGSLEICSRFVEGKDGANMRSLCYGGIFMQLFQPLEPDDEAMVAHIDVTKDNFVDFCNQFAKDRGRTECFERGSMLFPAASLNGQAMKHFCELSGDRQIIESCYTMIFSLVGSGSDYNVTRIAAICNTVEAVRRGDCYGMSAINMIDSDPAFIPRVPEVCEGAGDPGVVSACFSKVSWYVPYRFNQGTENFDLLCRVLPEEARKNSICAGDL